MLRWYQEKGINELRAAYAAGAKAPLYVLPTGGGKTFVFCHIAKSLTKRGRKACILVHRQELLLQSSRSLRKMHVDHDLIAPGFRERGAMIATASVQTLVRRIKKQPYDFFLIIIDEAHHAVAGTWKKIIEGLPNAMLLGVTATPCRTDGKGLGKDSGGVFDAIVIGPSIRELIEDGFLVRPVTYAPPTSIDLTGVKKRKDGDFNPKQLAGAIDKPKITGDAVAHYARLCPFKPAIVFCASVEHAEHVAREFQDAGFIASSIDGSMGDAQRRSLIAGLGNGKIHVLCSCDLISEGTDIPAVYAAIMLRPTHSESLYIQQGGRALRPVYAEGFDLETREGRLAAIAASEKPFALHLDHVGNCLRHGMLDDDREWSLDGLTKKKRGKNEAVTSLRQCSNCYAFVEPSPVCPRCGHVHQVKSRELEQVAGELKQLTKEELEQIRAQKKRQQGRAQTVTELLQLAIDRQYKNPTWWVKNIMQTRGNRVDISEISREFEQLKRSAA
jgi:DNA repair protein RadD